MATNPASSPLRTISVESTFVNIEAWADDAAQSLHALSLTESPPRARQIRGASVALEIPLDDESGVKRTEHRAVTAEDGHVQPRVELPRRELLRRDSLKRREALLKGKEGSRRRQRWENDRLLGNPYVQPPLPTDWEVRPTYPVHSVPYYVLPLWEAKFAARAAARVDKKRQAGAGKSKAADNPVTNEASEAVGKVTKELRQKIKRSRAAKGLLQDLEEQVRQFVQKWEADETGRQRPRDAPEEEEEIPEPDSEDDEVVFVGRNGQMSDVPPSPTQGMVASLSSSAGGFPQREKLVFDSLEEDTGASFGRWLVHSIGVYYGLDTWSVTVGNPARREAYVGIREVRLRSGERGGKGEGLPRPLWAMV